MIEKNYTKVNNIHDAEIAVFFDYAIGDPQTYQSTYYVPIEGQIGVASSDTTGTISAYGNRANIETSTTYTPEYGTVGYSKRTQDYTVFNRFISLTAYDVATYFRDKTMSVVWKSTVFSSGSSGELRHVVPYLVAAAKPYFGVNTGQKIEVNIAEDDPSVKMMREGVTFAKAETRTTAVNNH